MELNDIYPSKFLKAADLKGRTATVVIATAAIDEIGHDRKLVLYFQGKEKGLVTNKTNANRIGYLHGNNTDQWIGKEIALRAELVDYQGKTVQAIRVCPAERRAVMPPQQQPQTNGNYTIKPISGGGQLMEHNRSGERVPGSAQTSVDLDQEVPF